MKFNKVITGIDKSKSFRVYLAVSTKLVQDAKDVHQTSPLATHALGRAITGAALMGRLMKSDSDRLTVQFKGDGPAAEILCTAYGNGDVKGYIANPDVDLPAKPDGKPDVGGAMGIGTLMVIKDFGLKEPYMGRIDLVSGEIAEDLTAYYFISEQQESSIALGVKVGTDGNVIAAGGIVIQMLPDPVPEAVDALEAWIAKMPSISELISEATATEASDSWTEEAIMKSILESAFAGIGADYAVHPLEYMDIQWNCECSVERIEEVLLSLGAKEIKKIIDEDGVAELVCQFCETRYHFEKDDLEGLLAEALNNKIPKDFI